MLSSSLVSANRTPREDSSNKNIRIFKVDHAPMKMKIFRKLTPFLMKTPTIGNSVTFRPKKRISTCRVATPTIIRLETKAPIWLAPAPFYRRSAARGKAMNPGIKVTEPTRAAPATPAQPDCRPMIPEMSCEFRSDSLVPAGTMMPRNW